MKTITETELRNRKLSLINSINKVRKMMGENPCVDEKFFKWYDMPLDELEALDNHYYHEGKRYMYKYDPSSMYV